MRRSTLEAILSQAPHLKIMVVGDYFLDHYLLIDATKHHVSVETGKDAYQVTAVRSTPGAAGTVVNNLHALGVRNIQAVGLIGADGYGIQLSQLLQAQCVNTKNLLMSPKRLTPTYIKPMLCDEGREEELNRLDLKNWIPAPLEFEEQFVEILWKEGPHCDAIIVADQVDEDECGVITTRIRDTLAELGKKHSELTIFVDSRKRIDRFSHVLIKPNEFEGGRAVGMDSAKDAPEEVVKSLFARTRKPVFLTCGEQGQWVYNGSEAVHVPALQVSGPTDIVGAGDSTSAGIVVALAAGAGHREAAFLGNLVASITITKLGTTGTASPQEVRERYDAWDKQRTRNR